MVGCWFGVWVSLFTACRTVLVGLGLLRWVIGGLCGFVDFVTWCFGAFLVGYVVGFGLLCSWDFGGVLWLLWVIDCLV